MSTLLWIIYFTFALVSFIPVIRLEQVKSNPKYRILWFLSISVFAWSVFTGLKMIVDEPFFIYYFSLLTYPIVFVISYYIYYTLSIYMDKPIHRLFHLFAMIFFIINVIISMSNPWHFLMIKIPLNDTITSESFSLGEEGIFFIIHSLICYLLLMTGFAQALFHLYKKSKLSREHIFPFHLILVSVVFGIALNITHIYFHAFTLDPTYLFVVFVSFSLYTVIYQRDININLLSASKKVLFQSLREMYIISNHKGDIIEFSPNLIKRFQINPEDFAHMDKFLRYVKNKAILFDQYDSIKHQVFDYEKLYLNMHQQELKIKKNKAKGFITLLFDETRQIKLLHEIDYMRSHDLMTGLLNRNYFESKLDDFESLYHSIGVILIDVDGLKQHNDILGHHSGDQLIKRFSEVLKKLNLIEEDTLIFRFGGDEFMLIVPQADSEKLRMLIRFIEERTLHANPVKHIGFSYGCAIREKNDMPIIELIKECDIKLYERKSTKTYEKEELIQALKKEIQS